MNNLLTAERRQQIARAVVTKLGARRAAEYTKPAYQSHGSPTGVLGVDYTGGKFRARIRVTDSLSGVDCRITLGRFETKLEAGYAYASAHVRLYGALSHFVGEVQVEDLV